MVKARRMLQAPVEEVKEMGREKTILDDLHLIHDNLYEIYTSIVCDTHVKQANHRLMYPQIKLFFVLFQQGVEYTLKTYGEDALASALRLFSQFEDESHNVKTDVICYHPDSDQIQITYLHIVNDCICYESSVYTIDKHLDPNMHNLGASAYTLLQAIEECYHRYQIHHLGYSIPTTSEMVSRYEQEIQPVWQRAISDLNIPSTFGNP